MSVLSILSFSTWNKLCPKVEEGSLLPSLGHDALWDASALGLLDTAPAQVLAAAVTIGLVFPFHGDIAARAEEVRAFRAKGFSVQYVLVYRHRAAIGNCR